MAVGSITSGDLARDLSEVAGGLLAEPVEAVRATLDASARDLNRRSYTLWVWIGLTPEGSPVWALPAATATATDFRPPGPAAALARCVAAAIDAGADPTGVVLRDWDGLIALQAPGLENELSDLSLAERHPDAARISVAELPEGVVPTGPPIALRALDRADGADGLRALADSTASHPLHVAATLAAHGQSIEQPSKTLVGLLREWGLSDRPAPAPVEAPSLEIDDDPCPRRRQARRVLQRLLRMGKVGAGYHTEFDHLYRGVAANERADALAVGEALLRAGLLGEKPSVGQRHVYLRREALPAIHALIERGETSDEHLAQEWTAPPPGAG